MSRPIAAIEVTEVPDGGPALPVELTTDAPDGGPALPVVQVAAGSRAQLAIAPVRMSLVTSGVRARTGQRPVPIVVVAGGTPVTPPTPPASPLLTDLAARWSMDEASGNRLDSGPNLLHLAPTGTPTQEAGKLASAVGTSAGNYLSVADHAALRLRAGMTFAWWGKHQPAGGYGTFITKMSATAEYMCFVDEVAELAYADIYDAGGVRTRVQSNFGSAPSNVWFHIVVTIDAANVVRLYINAGVPIVSAPMSGFAGSASVLAVGAAIGGATALLGSADELTIWHRALPDPEIAQLYNGGAGLAWPYL